MTTNTTDKMRADYDAWTAKYSPNTHWATWQAAWQAACALQPFSPVQPIPTWQERANCSMSDIYTERLVRIFAARDAELEDYKAALAAKDVEIAKLQAMALRVSGCAGEFARDACKASPLHPVGVVLTDEKIKEIFSDALGFRSKLKNFVTYYSVDEWVLLKVARAIEAHIKGEPHHE